MFMNDILTNFTDPK